MQPFVVKLNDLKSGVTRFDWIADDEFFGKFENPEVLGASVEAAVKLVNRGVTIETECVLTGTITVPCDRCLEDVTIPISTEARMALRYGEEDEEGNGSADVTVIPFTATTYDLSWDIYEFICIALPLQRVHKDGECNEEITQYIIKQ